MSINIGPLVKADQEPFLHLVRQFRPVDVRMSMDDFSQVYDAVFATGAVYVARLAGKLVGTVKVLYERKFINNCALYAHIEDLIVDPLYRGEGIGGRLLEYARTQAMERGCMKCTLVCDDAVAGFYARHGFQRKGLHMAWYAT
jgi:GNAT superfamily N-acetyltransferase